MQDPNITIKRKAEDIRRFGFTFWYCGMQSLHPEELWAFGRHHQCAYLYIVLTGNCLDKNYEEDFPHATKYQGADNIWKAIPEGIDQKMRAGARSPKAFRIDKFQHFQYPLTIAEAWFSEFPFGQAKGALFVSQKQLPAELREANGPPSTSNRYWVGIARLCGDFVVNLM